MKPRRDPIMERHDARDIVWAFGAPTPKPGELAHAIYFEQVYTVQAAFCDADCPSPLGWITAEIERDNERAGMVPVSQRVKTPARCARCQSIAAAELHQRGAS